ncbi:hypothetical protein PVBG_05861 [Plasmodium vivax Brazil I]|uniref:VIR protein n=1 Tax=Plasmodium vivax (strain Brazil I) TaxID=1033975 RepID=A0A0J9T0X3_PLAV1|nr:hypothetical protein PVBG_05861 [Plasmodium vivax Brazil I]
MKSYFDSARDFSYDKDIYDTVVSSLTIPSSRESHFKDVLLKLMKYFSGDSAFMKYDKDHCCMYINYKLNKELKTLFYEVDDSIFEIFQDFAQKHDKAKSTQKCASKLHYPGSLIVYRLRHLYDLFDLYDELKNFSKLYNNESSCSKLTDIVHKYNLHIDEYYEKDKNLFNKLTNFKELVEKHNLPPNSKCQEKIKQLKTPAKYLSDQEELSRQKKLEQELKVQSQHGPSVSLPTIKSNQLEGGNLKTGESIFPEGQQFIALPEQAQDMAVLKHESRFRDNKETGGLMLAENMDSLETRESLALSEEPRYQTGYVRDKYILEQPTNDGEGIMKSLQSTFSTIVDNVEPASILGVSGGMGALYILLRVLKIFKL